MRMIKIPLDSLEIWLSNGVGCTWIELDLVKKAVAVIIIPAFDVVRVQAKMRWLYSTD